MQIIPIASGKGGVGKSLLSANLAVSLGKAGKKVVLADLDLGASNLHLAIGQQANKVGLGTYLSETTPFEDIITPTSYKNVSFIAGDAEIPGLTALTAAKKNALIKKLQNIETDYLILDLGAGTHLTILDMFLLSPQGILVTAPTVSAILNGYLFLKNAVFRLMYNSFKRKSPVYTFLDELKKDSSGLQRLYIPNLIQELMKIDPENTELFKERVDQFRPRLVMNMIEDPKDADKALKIRRSCNEYLGLAIDYLGVVYRDPMQDISLQSRLPITVYKPQSVLSQSIFRIAEKVLQSRELHFTHDMTASDNFNLLENEAQMDYSAKMSYVEDLLGSGALSTADLADTIKSQQYEITQLRKENMLLKSKILKAHKQGFSI